VTHDNKSGAGSLREDQAQLMFDEGFSFSGYERDTLFLGDGARFVEISGVSGIDSLSDGRAGVFADFDNDGDLDVFLTSIQGNAHELYRNNVGHQQAYLRIMLDGGREYGRDAFGAVVRVPTGGRILTKLLAGGMGYLSQHDSRLLFGLGAAASVDSVDVTWPDGRVERFAGPFTAGSTILLRAGSGRAESPRIMSSRLPDPLSKTELSRLGLTVQVGDRIPDLTVKTMDGRDVALRDTPAAGRRTLVNVWATWCVPCRAEMHELEALAPRLRAAGIDVVGLNVDTDADANLQAFLRRTGATYRILRGGVPAIEALYTTDELIVPMSFLLDDRGVVLDVITGWSEDTRRRLTALAGGRL
jgi:thiol-disulfide isomerase/thioredoxin